MEEGEEQQSEGFSTNPGITGDIRNSPVAVKTPLSMHTPASVNTPVSIKTPSSVKIVTFAEEAEVQGGGRTEAVTKDPSGEQGKN